MSVSFFLLLSGFVLAYNYRERAAAGRMDARKFWLARFLAHLSRVPVQPGRFTGHCLFQGISRADRFFIFI